MNFVPIPWMKFQPLEIRMLLQDPLQFGQFRNADHLAAQLLCGPARIVAQLGAHGLGADLCRRVETLERGPHPVYQCGGIPVLVWLRGEGYEPLPAEDSCLDHATLRLTKTRQPRHENSVPRPRKASQVAALLLAIATQNEPSQHGQGSSLRLRGSCGHCSIATPQYRHSRTPRWRRPGLCQQ